MAKMEISDLPAGFELLSDEETFLNELADEQDNLIYGGHCAPTPYTPIVLCATPPYPIVKTPPIPEPKPQPIPQPTPPVPAPWPIKITPPIGITGL